MTTVVNIPFALLEKGHLPPSMEYPTNISKDYRKGKGIIMKRVEENKVLNKNSQETSKKQNKIAQKKVRKNKSPFKKGIKTIAKVIQTLANIAIVFTLVVAIVQHIDTKEPLQTNIGMKKTEKYFNIGDYAEAAKRYNKYASKGVPEALNNLGYMHYKGLGVEQDIGKARDLYWEAYMNGSSLAINNLIVLSYENDSDQAKEDLAKIYNIAFQTKNEEWMASAISYVKAMDIDDVNYYEINNGKYDDIFEGGVEKIAERLKDPDNQYMINVWTRKEVLYFPHAEKAYTGETKKMVFQGAVVGNKEMGGSGIYYKYVVYERGMKCTDKLETGIERILDIEKNKSEEFK